VIANHRISRLLFIPGVVMKKGASNGQQTAKETCPDCEQLRQKSARLKSLLAAHGITSDHPPSLSPPYQPLHQSYRTTTHGPGLSSTSLWFSLQICPRWISCKTVFLPDTE
jgi:hypothetical protein